MNDIIPFAGQKVAKAFAHLDANVSLGDGIQGGFPSINYRAKVWSLNYQGDKHNFTRPDDNSPLTYLDVIVVGSNPNISKVYYPPGEWDEDSAGAPICAAINGLVPDPGVPEPQSKTCGTCKHNAWTTLPNGRRGKACQDHRRLAMLLMPQMTAKMLGAPLAEPVYLKVPPGSLSSLKTYGDSLRHQGYPFAAVVTRISFSQDKLFQINFAGLRVLKDTEAPLVIPFLDDPRTKRITGETPEIRAVAAAQPAKAIPKQVEPEPDEMSLTEAFGAKPNGTNGAHPPAQQEVLPPEQPAQEVRRGRGRPPKDAAKVAAAPQAAAAPPPPADDRQASMPWDDVDTELDADIANILNDKTSEMLK